MKAPSFSPAAAGSFFINHGEKVVVALFGVFALLMMWWGVSATQSHGVDRTRTPDAIEGLARQASASMERSGSVREGLVPPVRPMAPRVDPWRPQQVKLADAPSRALLFDRPMYSELTKRTKPEVFPMADLRAVAGVAVFADQAADPRGVRPRPQQPVVQPPQPPQPPSTPPRGTSRRPGRTTDQPEESGHGIGMGMGMDPMIAEVLPDEEVGPGRIAPFVVVTGLVPAGKQKAEFESRYANVSFRDPRRDTPRWTDYIVERTRVVPGAAPRWERLRLMNVSRFDAAPGAPPAAVGQGGPHLHSENLPAGFFLQPGETEIEYAAALPARVDGPWGEESLHPWFIPEIRELLEKGSEQPGEEDAVPTIGLEDLVTKPAKYLGKQVRLTGVVLETDSKVQKSARLHRFGVRSADGALATEFGIIGESEKPVFATSEQYGGRLAFDLTKPRTCNLLIRVDPVGRTPVARLLEIEFVDDDGEIVDTRKDPAPEPVQLADNPNQGGGGLVQQQPGVGVELAANRLFRFVDLGVVPGAEYRYRVRFAIRNPNVNLAPQHVADVAITKGDFLLADYSPETPAVRVPDTTRILARSIPRDAARKLKVRGDNVELIVMAKSDENGNYALRSVVTPPGGSANVDPSLNRPAAKLHFGQPVTTDRLLLDVRGGQEDRPPTRSQQPAEPLEMLLLRPDGEYDIVTAADSERFIRKYRSTLCPPGDDLPLDLKP
jgi:hypothetical protein